MLNKKIFYGGATIPIVIAIAMIVALPVDIERNTYSYENGSFPPADPIGIKSDPVSSLEEASKIVGFNIPEPNLPKGVTVQHIGVAGDNMVVMYASPNTISGETLDMDFMWKLQGIEIAYEKLPEYLKEKSNNELVQNWANSKDVATKVSSTGYSQGAYEIHKGEGHDGEFDKPARVLKAISEDVRVSVTGFYDVKVLEKITLD